MPQTGHCKLHFSICVHLHMKTICLAKFKRHNILTYMSIICASKCELFKTQLYLVMETSRYPNSTVILTPPPQYKPSPILSTFFWSTVYLLAKFHTKIHPKLLKVIMITNCQTAVLLSPVEEVSVTQTKQLLCYQ